MNDRTIFWGIIGAGRIARTFARGVTGSRTGKLAAVGSRTQSKAEEFAREFPGMRAHGTYEALLADPGVQAVYVATPHPMHAEWAIKAAEAGKHVLCEKPLALNHPEAMAVIEAARRHDVFLMEAFMYRCHPQTARLVELIREGAIGEVRVIQAAFGFHSPFKAEGRAFANELGGGGILDVGCYPVSMSRLIAGAARGQPFVEPIEVKGCAHLTTTGVDSWAVASLKFPGDILAELGTGVEAGLENVVRIFGSRGNLFVPAPWIPARDGGTSRIFLHKSGEPQPQEIAIETPRGLYSIEADTVAEHLERRQAPSPAMSWEDTLGNMQTLDRWRDSIGLVYESEKPENCRFTVTRRPLAVRPTPPMKYGQVAGIDQPISRLVMGVDNQRTMPHAAVMFDDFFEQGGNCFDTAYIYSKGWTERFFGHWVRSRGVRQQIVIVGKGAHTPLCDPDHIRSQLAESLDRMQTDHVDVYLMHRDNPDIPVGEFVEVLNEQVRAGRIRVFGGSNWSLDRVRAANRYAKRKGLAGFGAVSNQFSLARMIDPVWPGCLTASDPQSRAWFKKTQTPLFAWSSQARGFFARGNAEDRTDAELVRCWHSPDNFQRLERVRDLAQRRGGDPVAVALAYVLNQPFPTFALIGPRTLAETRSSMTGLAIELTRKELRWLNGEE